MLKVALVGCGGMAKTYRRAYASLAGVEWSLAVDTHAASLDSCLEAGVRRVSTRFEDALADDIDVVDISTPNHLHADQAIAAINAGKHVIIQKPLSNTLASADRIVDAAERHPDRCAGVFMSSYNNPLVWEIKQLIDSGKLGTIQAIHARDAHRGGLRAAPGTWRGDRNLTGGGSFIQLSIHAVNLISFWLNDRVIDVRAVQQNTLSPNIGGDDATASIVRYQSGTLGTFTSGYASDGMERWLYGTKGRLGLSHWDQRLYLNMDEPFEGQIIHYTTPGKCYNLEYRIPAYFDTTNPCNGQRRFIESVQGKTPLQFDVLTGRNDLAVIDAVHQSAQQDGWVVAVHHRSPRPQLQASVFTRASNMVLPQPVHAAVAG